MIAVKENGGYVIIENANNHWFESLLPHEAELLAKMLMSKANIATEKDKLLAKRGGNG